MSICRPEASIKLRPTAFPAEAPLDGKYKLKSRAKDNGADICVEGCRDDQSDGGRYQQQDCGDEHTTFPVDPHADNHTCTIYAFTGRIMTAHDYEEYNHDVLGLGANQVSPWGRAYDYARARWVLEATPGAGPAYRIRN